MRALTILLVLAIAGCASQPAPDQTGPPAQDPEFLSADLPTGIGARDFIDSYIMTHPFRLHGPATQDFMDTAREDLAALLEGMGHDVTLQDYGGGINILGIQEGTAHPEQWVVLSAHYDTVGAGIGPTVYGAWDDGAGVSVLLELARAFADWEFPFTIVYAFFDGEEKGLVGSREFMKVYDPTEQNHTDILANINTDPPGLNWPCGDTSPFPVKIIHELDKLDHPRYGWLYHAVEHGLNATGVPVEVRDYTPGIPVAVVEGQGVTGGSDHLSFGARGIANVFLGGTPTTYATGSPSQPGTAALTYPLHTPLDTLQAMEARCVTGTLAGGLETIVGTFTQSLSWMAMNPAPHVEPSLA